MASACYSYLPLRSLVNKSFNPASSSGQLKSQLYSKHNRPGQRVAELSPAVKLCLRINARSTGPGPKIFGSQVQAQIFQPGAFQHSTRQSVSQIHVSDI